MDLVNSIFELLGGVFMFLSCYKLYKDKDIKGISIPSVIFFTIWSYWNILYYVSLNQPISLFAGILLAFFNSVWVIMAILLLRKKNL